MSPIFNRKDLEAILERKPDSSSQAAGLTPHDEVRVVKAVALGLFFLLEHLKLKLPDASQTVRLAIERSGQASIIRAFRQGMAGGSLVPKAAVAKLKAQVNLLEAALPPMVALEINLGQPGGLSRVISEHVQPLLAREGLLPTTAADWGAQLQRAVVIFPVQDVL